MSPLCIDLYSGLGGWAEGFLAEGFDVVGFDIERHVYGEQCYPAQLVLQDALTIHGSQFKNAAVIVASPPCQKYSWLAMPWSRSKDPNNSKAAKALRAEWEANGPDNRLFDACFRIQREAIEAATLQYGCAYCGIYHPATFLNDCTFTQRHIPLIVENVRGAQPWVGRAVWNYGSFYLWGDVPALMPFSRTRKQPGRNFHFPEKYGIPSPSFHGAVHEPSVQRAMGVKQAGLSGPAWFDDGSASHSSDSSARKAASAQMAKIPFELSSHIARCYFPQERAA